MESSVKPSKINKKLLLIGMLIVFALFGATVYYFQKYQTIKKNPEKVAQEEVNRVVKIVGQLISLPNDETPVLATIKDREKIKDQPFFSNAQNDDVILIYTKAKKAIVFREKDKKIINVGPISIDQQNGTPVALVNAGGNVADITKKINDKFTGTVTITGTTDAKNKANVKEITVVDVAGNSGDIAKQIAETIGGKVGELPAGENAPGGANIVVFVK